MKEEELPAAGANKAAFEALAQANSAEAAGEVAPAVEHRESNASRVMASLSILVSPILLFVRLPKRTRVRTIESTTASCPR